MYKKDEMDDSKEKNVFDCLDKLVEACNSVSCDRVRHRSGSAAPGLAVDLENSNLWNSGET